MPRGSVQMSDHEKSQLIDAVMHYITPEIRGKVMREVPKAYNSFCGREVVKVEVTNNDGSN